MRTITMLIWITESIISRRKRISRSSMEIRR